MTPAALTLRHAPMADYACCDNSGGQLMERTQTFDLMASLSSTGWKAGSDEIMTTGVKRQHGPQRIAGDLLSAGNEKQARSILPAHYPQVAVC
ncbi:hypothetical protein ABIB68_007758 [Bradyrhizobium sp. F1.2.2]